MNVHVINGIRRLDRGLRVAAREVQRATGLSAAASTMGDLSVASQPGAGACFTRRLPLYRADSAAVRDAHVAAALVS